MRLIEINFHQKMFGFALEKSCIVNLHKPSLQCTYAYLRSEVRLPGSQENKYM
jgi:hypothetical protein